MAAAKVVVVLEEAAELAIRACLIGEPSVTSREMTARAQARIAKFQERGTITAG
ncbi:MAG: hypothetical protein ACE1Z2_04565 [Acidobacteriota bacterium]|nr:hypothetical protein [Deltaproteobacteria bacterium]MCZ6561345.1 hypothetical protein [Deltaproteobacteria bacterium]